MAYKTPTAQRLDMAFKEAVTAGLNYLGHEAVQQMKRETRVYKGRLRDSETFALKGAKTSKYFPATDTNPGNPNLGLVGPKANVSSDVISPVGIPYYLKVGTRVSHARYVDRGTGAHKTKTDWKGFLKRIYEWGKSKGFTNDQIESLIYAIRRGGTRPHPFMPAAEEYLKFMGGRVLKSSVSRVLRSLPPVRYEVKGGRLRKIG